MARPLVALAIAGLLAAGGASAQSPDWSHAARLDVRLSNFAFSPDLIHLRAGRPVTLRLANDASGAHNFSAPAFFAGSAIRVEDQGLVYKGAIELAGGQAKEITLAPRAGRYKLRCTHTMHAVLGMKGEIVVD